MNNDKFIQLDKHIFTQKMLEKIDIGVIYTSMVANRESIFVFGGDDAGFFTPSAEVRRYDFSDQKWHKMKEMPHYLWGSTAQIVDGEIFIMGGGRQSSYSARNLVYNIAGNYWANRADLPISRKGLASGLIDGIIYIAGGHQMWGAYDIDSYCYGYNTKADTWKKCKKDQSSKSFAMSVVIDNCLYVLGGYEFGQLKGQATAMHRYCPETDCWQEMGYMPRSRMNSVAVAIDSKIFVLCGISDDGKEYITMDYYHTKTQKWTMSDISTPQLRSPGVAVIDNKIYLTGGIDKGGEYNRNLYEITYCGMKE